MVFRKSWVGLTVAVILLFTGVGINPAIAVDNSIETISIGKTLYVGGSGEGNYSKIQDAIDNASWGDTVFVYDDSSPYIQHDIQIDKSIKLIGENRDTTIIDGKYYKDVISINANRVNITGFTIRNGGGLLSTGGFFAGIKIKSNNNIINNNIIENNNQRGIILYNTRGNTIKNNIIRNNEGSGILLFTRDLRTVISNNYIDNNLYGIFAGDSIRLTIKDNTFVDNHMSGLTLYNSIFCVVKNNNFMGNQQNAYFEFSSFYLYFPSLSVHKIILLKIISRTCIFDSNYWDGEYILPYRVEGGGVLEGTLYGDDDINFTIWKYDWRPAKEPYDIEV